MKLKTLLAITAIVAAQSGLARADEIDFQVNNVSAKAVVALYATPKDNGEASAVNLLEAGSIAAAATGAVVITSETPQCVYNLKIGFDDGSSLDRSDVDLCQTDALIID